MRVERIIHAAMAAAAAAIIVVMALSAGVAILGRYYQGQQERDVLGWHDVSSSYALDVAVEQCGAMGGKIRAVTCPVINGWARYCRARCDKERASDATKRDNAF